MLHAISSRGSRGARWALSLILVATSAACAPPAPSLSEVPIAIDYVWPSPAQPLDDATTSVDPSGLVIRWQPGHFSAADIQGIASEQCGMFHRRARASGPPVPTAPLLTQRFACVETPGNRR